MLCEVYIEAPLVDEELADQVWELWDGGVIGDELAAIAWLLLTARTSAMRPKAVVELIGC